jgi:class 3 adenylate cyclase/pimeloyl-ACP methyl ester carboxylesterase
MEQQIRFCTASDGVRIAYATLGEGLPLVYVTGWPGHLELEWEKPFASAFLEELAQGCLLVRYDMRGSGLSDKDVSDFSLEVLIRDLEAVVDHWDIDRFALLSLGMLAGPISATYAVAHPDRVTHLIMNGGVLRGADVATPERQRALIDYVSAFGFPHIDFLERPDIDVESQRGVRQLQKAAAAPATQAELLRTYYSTDISLLAAQLRVPTLVLHGRADRFPPFDLGRELAATIPGARFVPFEGAGTMPWSVSHIILPEIHKFLGIEVAAPEISSTSPQGLVTILFTDVEGSTALTERLGDDAARDVLRVHEQIVRAQLREHGGAEVKALGDGFMAYFPSVSGALQCAIALQRALAKRNEERPETPMRVRIGLNAGEPIVEANDLFGTAVNMAARIAAQAQGGEIFAADVVRQLAAGKGFLFADRGATALRGFEDAVRIYELGWQE